MFDFLRFSDDFAALCRYDAFSRSTLRESLVWRQVRYMKKKLFVIRKLLCYPSPFLWYDNSKGGIRKITYFTKDSI